MAQLSQSTIRKTYIDQIKIIETDLKNIESGENNDGLLKQVQVQLDELTKDYKDSEEIGTAKYKLYELQAFIYFLNNDDRAMGLIEKAVEIRGNDYVRADKLKAQIAAKAANSTIVNASKIQTKKERRKNLIGLEGWLAFFVVGQFFSIIITISRFFNDGAVSSSDVDVLNQYQSGLGDTLQNLTTFEDLAVFVYLALIVTTLVFLFRKQKLAKYFAIAVLVFASLYGLIDYMVASSVFESSGLSKNAELTTFMSSYASDVGRNLLVAAIWIPYFMVSKRVKATLTN